jgi:hypothetical protein
VLASALRPDQPFAPPEVVRLLLSVLMVRSLLAHIFGLGLWPVA